MLDETKIGNFLRLQRFDTDGVTTLKLIGIIDLSAVLRLRDIAFSIIGERPSILFLDVRGVSQMEIVGIHTLVTISRVARLVKIPCFVIPSPSIRDLLLNTGLKRMLPLQDEVERTDLGASTAEQTPYSLFGKPFGLQEGSSERANLLAIIEDI